LAGLAGIARRLAELAAEGYTDIGRELAGDFVAQPEGQRGVGQAGANPARRIVFAVQAGLDFGCEHQALRQQQIVLRLEPQRRAPRLAHIGGQFGLDFVWRHALQAERQPVALRAGAEIAPGAQLHVPVRRDGAAPERLDLGRRGAADAFAFALDPQAVPAPPEPEFAVPLQAGAAGPVVRQAEL